MALPFPTIDPVLIELGPIAIRWYSLAYMAGILLGWLMVKKLNEKHKVLTEKALEDIVVWAVLGVVIGGRLGYVLFYQPAFYFENPSHILKVWEGGMSFHGGFLGVLAAMFLFTRKHATGAFMKVMDLCAVAAPIGLFFGRLANFINGELYGRATDVPWAVIFPHSGDGLPRHPSQLYEAVLEGALLFAVSVYLATKTRALENVGTLSGVFLIGYGVSRMLVEIVREPDVQLGTLALGMTMGQWLSVPMVLLGIWLIRRAQTRAA